MKLVMKNRQKQLIQSIEYTNNVVKSHHSLRRRLLLGHYLNNAEQMITQWSLDRTIVRSRHLYGQ